MVWKLSSFKGFQQGKKRSAWSYVLAGDTLAQGGKRGGVWCEDHTGQIPAAREGLGTGAPGVD